ncbi:hypothetical protein Nmel_008261, partial [Mimus melanotis]
PKTNIWITLANLTGQDTLYLATASPENPFSTCLIGLPLDTWPHPPSAHVLNFENHADVWDQWVPYLPRATLKPQDLELLGSVKMDFCVKFNYSGVNHSKAWDVSLSQCIFRNENGNVCIEDAIIYSDRVIGLPFLIQCIQRLINKLIKQIMIVEQKGGDVEDQTATEAVVPQTSWPWYSGSCGREKLKARRKVKTSCLVSLTALMREDATRTLLTQKN